jgi:hypothetical protein
LIPQRNISLLANRLARAGGRRIPESVLERDYCLAWLLSSLAESDLRLRLEPVYAGVREVSGIEFAFDREDRHSYANSLTFLLALHRTAAGGRQRKSGYHDS